MRTLQALVELVELSLLDMRRHDVLYVHDAWSIF
jgi:hypothetical protein